MTILTNRDVRQQMNVVIGYIVIVIAAAAGFAFINAFASAGSPSPSPSPSFLTYDNPEHHVKIEYPANWTAEEKNLQLESQVVRIFPNDFLADHISPVGLEIYDTPRDGSDNLTLSQLSIDREGYTKTSPYTRFVNSTNTTISGLPAYSILYYDFPNPIFTTTNQTQKILHTMTLSDNGFFNIVYYAQPEYFDKYLLQAKKMLDSFQITDK